MCLVFWVVSPTPKGCLRQKRGRREVSKEGLGSLQEASRRATVLCLSTHSLVLSGFCLGICRYLQPMKAKNASVRCQIHACCWQKPFYCCPEPEPTAFGLSFFWCRPSKRGSILLKRPKQTYSNLRTRVSPCGVYHFYSEIIKTFGHTKAIYIYIYICDSLLAHHILFLIFPATNLTKKKSNKHTKTNRNKSKQQQFIIRKHTKIHRNK